MNKILILAACLVPAALPQTKTLSCDEGGNWRDSGRYCEIREATIPAGGSLDVDARPNGGISIKGADRNDILVRSKVESDQDDRAASKRVVSEVRVETAGGHVHATGPVMHRHGWSVSYEIFVPNHTNLTLRSENGGIHIASVRGHTEFETVNGGVSLQELAGDVEGHTTNGGVIVDLAGNRWEGDRCDVSTTNGGVTIRVPSAYSARLETGTVNGGVSIDFPVTMQGEISRHISVNLGSGGKLVRATTTNGGVRVERI